MNMGVTEVTEAQPCRHCFVLFCFVYGVEGDALLCFNDIDLDLMVMLNRKETTCRRQVKPLIKCIRTYKEYTSTYL